MKVRKVWMAFILVLIMITANLSGTVFSHQNPMTLTDQWNDYGIGDPYIMKYNGVYYLYVSTKDSETGVKCWSSPDLTTFTYEGLCATNSITKASFAPEVFYWNGFFYMYTSPAGQGHYILRSNDPTGPFEPISGNLGLSIDGTVFVDDDGSKYFYYAGNPEILANPMTSHENITQTRIKTGASVSDAWTEGATVFKRNGLYYMTYCGNHVVNDAYRIHYAVSSNPVSGFIPSEQNPILCRVEGATRGLGHNSIVIGPDLDTYYIVYHNLVSLFGPIRQMNIDPIVWNNEKLYVLGPTDFEVANPQMPNYYCYFNEDEKSLIKKSTDKGDLILSAENTKSDYTAEFNLWAKDIGENRENKYSYQNNSPLYGIIYSYIDSSNYGYAQINIEDKTLDIGYIEAGEDRNIESIQLPDDFNYSALHMIKIQKQKNVFKFYLDGMLKLTCDDISILDGGAIGYFEKGIDAEFGFTAFSDKVNGNFDHTITKSVPGAFDAVHANSGSKNVLVECEEGGNAVKLVDDQYLQFDINVKKSGYYTFDVRYASEEGAEVSFILNDESIIADSITLPNTVNGKYRTYPVRAIYLNKGNQSLKLSVNKGSGNFYRLGIYNIEKNTSAEINSPKLNVIEGGFIYRNSAYDARNSDSFGKAVYGTEALGDYIIETRLKIDKGVDAGILFRARALTNGNDPSLGIVNADYHQGYYAAINEDGVILGKQNFDSKLLESASYPLKKGVYYDLKVDVKGDNYKIYLNGGLIIDYTDYSNPYTTGKVGIRNYMSTAKFDGLVIKPVWNEYKSKPYTDPNSPTPTPSDDETDPPGQNTPDETDPAGSESPLPAETDDPDESAEPTDDETRVEDETKSYDGAQTGNDDQGDKDDQTGDKDNVPDTGDKMYYIYLLLAFSAIISYLFIKKYGIKLKR